MTICGSTRTLTRVSSRSLLLRSSSACCAPATAYDADDRRSRSTGIRRQKAAQRTGRPRARQFKGERRARRPRAGHRCSNLGDRREEHRGHHRARRPSELLSRRSLKVSPAGDERAKHTRSAAQSLAAIERSDPRRSTGGEQGGRSPGDAHRSRRHFPSRRSDAAALGRAGESDRPRSSARAGRSDVEVSHSTLQASEGRTVVLLVGSAQRSGVPASTSISTSRHVRH